MADSNRSARTTNIRTTDRNLLNIGRTDIDAPRVSLGLELSENESARFIDDKVIAALETGALNNELRLRLQRPIRTVAIDTFRIDNVR